MNWTQEDVDRYQKRRGQAPVALPKPVKQETGPKMNKTEARYSEILEARKRAGEIVDWQFEGIKLRLADGAFYTPDFFVVMPGDVVEVHETKGSFIREAALVRFKVGRSLFPWFRFRMLQYEKGEWREIYQP